MDSRELIVSDKISIHIDSQSFTEGIEDEKFDKLISYAESEFLDFKKSPNDIDISENFGNSNIPYYQFKWEKGEIRGVHIDYNRGGNCSWAFYPKLEVMKRAAIEIYGKDNITQEELESIIQIYAQEMFNSDDKTGLYVTKNKIILAKRLYIESKFYQGKLNIVSPDEACEIVGLFFKNKKQYFVSCNFSNNKGYWYWTFMRNQVPRFHVGDPIMDSLAKRFYFCSMSLDEMGIQYFLNPGNDTIDNTIYHFNYFISLITGIFDNLALKTDSSLEINFTPKMYISINNKRGNKFLKEVRDKRQDIRDYIIKHNNYIKLIYEFRDLIIHQEMLSNFMFEDMSRGSRWRGNFIKITPDVKALIDAIKLDEQTNDPFTKWGLHIHYRDISIEPYHFAKQILKYLSDFIDGYLELLGFSPATESLPVKDDFQANLKRLRKFSLTALDNS